MCCLHRIASPLFGFADHFACPLLPSLCSQVLSHIQLHPALHGHRPPEEVPLQDLRLAATEDHHQQVPAQRQVLQLRPADNQQGEAPQGEPTWCVVLEGTVLFCVHLLPCPPTVRIQPAPACDGVAAAGHLLEVLMAQHLAANLADLHPDACQHC
jgi:hypothetical protein